MEINDIEYVDELLRGLESKLGATVPTCLLQPILAGSSSSSSHEDDCSSTPLRSSEQSSSSTQSSPDVDTCTTNDDASGINREQVGGAEAFASTLQEMSPVKQFSARRQRLEKNCRKLKSDMSALRAVDVSLTKQLLTVYDAVEEIRWMIESYDLSDSCESINSSVYESIEQIHEKWVTERRQWQSASSRLDLSNLRDDSRFNTNHVGRLNSTGSRRPATGDVRKPVYGLSLQSAGWRSPQKDMNSSFPQLTSGKSNFEKQRRSSVDHLPIIPTVESPPPSPSGPRKRRSSSGAFEAGVVEGKDEENQEGTSDGRGRTDVKKPKLLFHSKSSPSFDSQLQWVEVTDTAII